MAVASITEGMINPQRGTLSNGPAGLYEAYAQIHVHRDWGNVASRRDNLSMNDRLVFAEECAFAMFRSDSLQVDPETAKQIARRTIEGSNDETLDEVLTDLRTCSFLTTASHGALEFIHRSYQEFFLARRLRDEINRGSLRLLSEELRWEYLYFLGAFAFTDNDFYNRLIETSQSTSTGADERRYADNAAVAVLAAREQATDLRWDGRTVRNLRRPRSSIVRGQMKAVHLLEPEVTQLEIADSNIELTLVNGVIGTASFLRSHGTISLQGATANLELDGGELNLTVQSPSGRLKAESMSLDLTLEGSHSQSMELRQVRGSIRAAHEGAIWDTHIHGSELNLDSGRGTVSGIITESLLDLPIDTFDQLSAQLNKVTLIVRGQRPRSVADSRGRGARLAAHTTDRGQDLVLLVDPNVRLDGWWTDRAGVITIGGDQGDKELKLPGLTVRSKTPARPDPPKEFVRVRQLGPHQLLLEGVGRPFTSAVSDLQQLTSSATLLKVREAGWLGSELRQYVANHGAPGAADQLAELIDAHERLIPDVSAGL